MTGRSFFDTNIHGFSFWDSLILRMAQQAGCRVLFSENLQEGRKVEGIQVVNPFRQN